jgi:hypothetical protein
MLLANYLTIKKFKLISVFLLRNGKADVSYEKSRIQDTRL